MSAKLFDSTLIREPQDAIHFMANASARDITEQARLQTQLAEERAYNRGLIEASLDGLITLDPLLKIADVNETMCTMSGYSRIRLIGSAFPDYFVDSRRAAEGVRLTLDKGPVTNYDLTLKKSDGRTILVSFNAATFKDQSGVVRGIFSSARNITKESQLQTQLAEERAYNRGPIEASVDGLVTVDESMTITDVNETMCRMAGRPRNQLLGSSFPSYSTDPQCAAEGVRLTFQQGAVTNYVLNLQGVDGYPIPVSFKAVVFRGPTGEVRRIFASAWDITAQKQLEQQLRASQFYTRSLIESNIDALMTTAPIGIITDVNETMCRMAGYTRAHLIGTPFADYFTDPGRARGGVQQTFEAGVVTEYALTLVARSRSLLQVSFNASVFKDAAGNVRGIFASARDVTDRMRLEDQMRETQADNRGPDRVLGRRPFCGRSGRLYHRRQPADVYAMTACGRDEPIGSTLRQYFTDPERADRGIVVDDSPQNTRLARGTLEPFVYETVLANSEDEGLQATRRVASRPHPVRFAKGLVCEWRGLFLDTFSPPRRRSRRVFFFPPRLPSASRGESPVRVPMRRATPSSPPGNRGAVKRNRRNGPEWPPSWMIFSQLLAEYRE